MVGHSKWANIRRRESAQTRRRSRAARSASGAGRQLVRFEGYGPGDAAVMVDCLTDDRGRMSAEVRQAFI